MRRFALRHRGFTATELLIGVVVIGLLIAVGVPSFKNFIAEQRLKSITSQLVTDLQFARSEAVSRGVNVRFRLQGPLSASNTTMSCYTIYADTNPAAADGSPCNCKAAEGSRCTGSTQLELRTVQLPTDMGIEVTSPNESDAFVTFDPRIGGIPPIDSGDEGALATPPDFIVVTRIDAARRYQAVVGSTGKVGACVPSGSKMGGTAC